MTGDDGRLDREQAMMALLTARLKDEGYEVFTGRYGSLMPTFLENLRPDLIAMKSGRNLMIDIKERRLARNGGLALLERAALAEAVCQHHPDWEYQLVSVSPGTLDADMATPNRDRIEIRLADVNGLLRTAGLDMALMSAWATLEAAARWRWPGRLAQPQMPARLVELLAYEGYLMPEEERRFREVQKLRNRVVHGDLDVMIGEDDVACVTRIARLLLDEDPADAAQ